MMFDILNKLFRHIFRYNILYLFILINTILLYFIGGYLEDYEGLYASISRGLYTDYALNDYFQDFHTLLFYIYTLINKTFPTYNVYGIVLYILNILSLIFFAYVLYKYYKQYIFLFFLCYIFFALDSILNISSNRIVITLISTTLFYLLNTEINCKKYVLSFLIFTFCLLIKSEIVILISFVYLFGIFFTQKSNKIYLSLFIYSLLYFILVQYLYSIFFTEARQTFLYYEFDFIDKSNINYSILNNSQLIDVIAFKRDNIVDSVHFTSDFYNSIHYDNFLFSKTNIYQSLAKTFSIFKTTILYLLINILFILLLIYNKKYRHVVLCLFILIFPFFVSLIINIPDRFITTYNSILAIFILRLLIINRKWVQFYKIIFLTSITLILIKIPSEINRYQSTQDKVESFFNKIVNLNEKNIVINNVEYMGRYFPVDPFYRIKETNLTFLNFWYFTTYNSYISYWEKLCSCNPLSINEKLNCIIDNNLFFITSDKDFINLSYYIFNKYNKKISIKNRIRFDDTLFLCNLTYDK
jgi:hypothetical protein